MSHHDLIPSFFMESLANQDGVQSSKEDLFIYWNLFTGASWYFMMSIKKQSVSDGSKDWCSFWWRIQWLAGKHCTSSVSGDTRESKDMKLNFFYHHGHQVAKVRSISSDSKPGSTCQKYNIHNNNTAGNWSISWVDWNQELWKFKTQRLGTWGSHRNDIYVDYCICIIQSWLKGSRFHHTSAKMVKFQCVTWRRWNNFKPLFRLKWRESPISCPKVMGVRGVKVNLTFQISR